MKYLLISITLLTALSGVCSEIYQVKTEVGVAVGVTDFQQLSKTMPDACKLAIDKAKEFAERDCATAGGEPNGISNRLLEITKDKTPNFCRISISLNCIL